MSEQSVYHSLVTAFQTEVIKRALATTAGNRTRAARLLGLQRTYLLRLMRDRSIDVPRSQRKGRHGDFAPTVAPAPPELRIEITGWEPLTPPNGDDGHPAIATAAQRRAMERGQPVRSARQAPRHAG